MADPLLAAMWLTILVCGLGAAIVVHRRLGVSTTYVRDLLHVGASVWLLGWPHWNEALWPVAITAVVALTTALMPRLSRRLVIAAKLRAAVTNGEERWAGLTHYTFAYFFLTAVAFELDVKLAAGAALAALAWGDGLGGAFGRRFGRLRYRVPWAKEKTLEGTLAVVAAAAAAVWVWSRYLGEPLALWVVAGAGIAAAVFEAAAPRASDNLLVPGGTAIWMLTMG